jgi:hypothetical protein
MITKIEKIIYYILASLSIFIGFFYTIGLYYFAGYQSAFGINYGFLKFNFHDTIHFGFLILNVELFILFKLIVIFSIVFAIIEFSCLFLKNKIVSKYNIKLKKYKLSEETEKRLEKYFIAVAASMVIPICIIVNLCCDYFSYKRGFSSGEEMKKNFIETFANLNKQRMLNDLPFVIEVRNPIINQMEEKIGFFICSDEQWIAFYTKEDGLIISRPSDLGYIKKYKVLKVAS